MCCLCYGWDWVYVPPSRDSHFFHYVLHHLESQRHSRVLECAEAGATLPSRLMGGKEPKAQRPSARGTPRGLELSAQQPTRGQSHTGRPTNCTVGHTSAIRAPRRTKEVTSAACPSPLPLLDSRNEDTEEGDSTQEKGMRC